MMPANFSGADTAPATKAFAILPHDTAALATIPKGVFVGKGGDVTCRPVGSSNDVVYKNLPDASYLAIRLSHIRAAGTTASFLVGEA